MIILSTLCLSVYAQHNQTIKKTVIAAEGLNLRSGPSMTSPVIHSIRFLDQVEVPLEESGSLDTLKVLKFDTWNDTQYKSYVSGRWVKAKHKNKVGFVFSAYIQLLDNRHENTFDQQYGINFVGTNCFDNVHRNRRIKWKGVYKIKDKYFIKDVSLNYYDDQGEMTGFGTTTNQNRNLLFVVGSSNERFRNGEVKGTYYQSGLSFGLDNKAAKNEVDGFSTESNKTESTNLFLHKNGIKENISEDIHNWPNSLIWKGDLDGDEIDDYIISFGDKGGGYILFLSTEGNEEISVKPVAIYDYGYCC